VAQIVSDAGRKGIAMALRSLRRLPVHPQWLLPEPIPGSTLHRLTGVVLDVGCASRWVEGQCGPAAQYVGVDLPATGTGLYGARPDVFADAAALPIATASVDNVVCLEVLEHVEKPGLALAEFGRVLRDGGGLVITMPFMYPIHDAPYDFQRLTEHGLRRDLAAAGLTVEVLQKRGHALRSAALLVCLALCGGIYQRRNWFDLLLAPFAALAVLAVNLSAAAASLVIPDWNNLATGYVLVARKQASPDAGDAKPE
jgi:SAM-dependent methyltransferase